MGLEVITDFNAGELDPMFDGRVDIAPYGKAAKQIVNAFVHPSGGVLRRPGTLPVTDCMSDSKKSILVPYTDEDGNEYLIELNSSHWRVIQLDGTEVQAETAHSYGEIPDWAQWQNRTYLASRSAKPGYIQDSSGTFSFVSPTYVATTGPTHVFATAGNYPAFVTFHSQRLIFASSDNEPETIWGSKIDASTADYFHTFTLGSNPGDGFMYTIATKRARPLRWVATGRNGLLYGTDRSEVIFTGPDGALDATAPNMQEQSTYGGSRVKPEQINNGIAFVQRGGNSIRLVAYNLGGDGYSGQNLNLMSSHIFDVANRLEFMREPWPMLWVATDDGILATCTIDMDQGIIAWSHHATEGTIEDVCVVTTGTGEDDVYITVLRGTDRYIEKFAPIEQTERDELQYMDRYFRVAPQSDTRAITGISQATQAVISTSATLPEVGMYVYVENVVGMTEMNAKYHEVVAVGTGTFTVDTDSSAYTAYTSGGDFTEKHHRAIKASLTGYAAHALDEEGGVVPAQEFDGSGYAEFDRYVDGYAAGIPYTTTIQTLRIGSSKLGFRSTVNKVILRLYESILCKVGPDTNNLEQVLFRTADDLLDDPPAFFTGDKETAIPGGSSREKRIYVIQDEPLPLMLQGLYMETGE